ncbi:MAG TPA: alpha/beta fold hydrolase [Gaiellaceae bacterium]|jgi:pimeloyl-ACP methyl ester carboxylesterase|nr:alpha/beta fold hydrolase [Gaiellaceae bacterium]
MHMHRWGSRDDVPVVFWHALGTSGADFAPVGKTIAGAGFYVLAVDGPGFGKSKALEPDAYRLDALVELLHEQLIELDRPVLIGHSWGGAVAVRYAGAHPEDVRALVLLDSGHLDYVDLEEKRAFGSDPRGMAMTGLLDRVSPAWPAIAANQIPTLLFLATQPPHVEVNRAHVPKFEAALPHADVRWLDGVSHGVVEDVGAPLGEDIAGWLVEQGI